ncbi:DegT/DnrJ/EryC1/StrS family aminotransferase [Dinghuibacter silviterrae]|uniref:dTDP-4-amino-4,6-dideoxygalactose transaminase n=1 Tax=Dinghuibacter silviterrae TaxID=1539049 RepID=A0A4R8DFD4_9BACT|nr:DegT/DnrJ/EryC1/StrS family aminotransferase [Dinghuibacter silviterrae]TDW95796.1 dTDP-4-amino-4,6-dideoxygalactose transaminase [Dinghuibacter silviterrae]
MRAIQMVDLQQQYARIKDQIDEGIREVLDTARYINGPAVQSFAHELAEYLGVKNVIPCANGTDALQIVLMALRLERGDEVITPSFTYIATTEVVALLGLTPVFVEVDPKTFCIDPKALEAAITPRTKAIVPVHLYGQAAPMAEILAVADKHGIPVIEDNAQAIGSTYTFPDGTTKKTGTLGLAGCTSFFPSKNLGCYGDGGAICTDDDALAAKLRMIANHGQSKQYYHDVVGCNSRLDSIQAAILRVKLKELDGYIAARRKVADFYDAAFAGHAKIRTPYRAPYTHHVFHQYTLQLEGADRGGLNTFLASRQIPSMIYYPVPGHRQQMFAGKGGVMPHLPVTDDLTTKVISLPMHTELDDQQLFHITGSVLEYLNA